MFRSMSGFKAQYQNLTLLVISEFNEWRVLVYAPGATIHGAHQFGEAKAKEHALSIARKYLDEYRHDELPVITETQWVPTTREDWLIWSG